MSKKQQQQDLDDEEYVNQKMKQFEHVIKNKNKELIKQGFRNEYLEQKGIKPQKYERPGRQEKNIPKQQKQTQSNPDHYKKFRKDQFIEKKLRSQFNNEDQLKSKKNNKKFQHYRQDDIQMVESYIENNRQGKQNYQKDYQRKEQQNYKQNNQPQNKNKQFRDDYNRNQNYKQYDRRDKKRRNVFDHHWNQKQLQEGLEKQTLFEGIFIQKENQKNMAQIKCPIFPKNVYVNTLEDQNRAFHGCLVVFQIIDNKKIKDIELPESDVSISEEEDLINIELKKNLVEKQVEQKVAVVQQQEVQEKEDDWEDLDSDEEAIKEGEKVIPQAEQKSQTQKNKPKQNIKETRIEQLQKVRLLGRVVGIKKNPYENKDIAGQITVNLKNQSYQPQKVKNLQDIIDNYYFSFKSINKRLTWFNIHKFDNKLLGNLDINKLSFEEFTKYIGQRYFAARMSIWEADSKYPFCEIVREIGLIGDIETECEALLIQNDVYFTDFSAECQKQLETYKCNEQNEYIIPQEERDKRLDLTKEIICTVDPVTARDLDDALSINQIDDDTYEVGVHIADVSHFVAENTEVDKEAQLRTTSVYLVHRVIPMLPRMLCENLCSLNPGVERLAFSVFFYIKNNGEIQWDRPIKACKSIIKSCAKLSYDVVNQFIEKEIESFLQVEDKYKIHNDVDPKVLLEKLILLNELGQKRRAFRMNDGSISFNKNKLRFKLRDNLYPEEVLQEKRGQAQFMVEEWMLLANQFVGKKLVDYDKEQAVLRNHSAPQTKKIDYFKNVLKECGFLKLIDNFDVSTSVKLKQTLETINNDDSIDEIRKQILSFRLLKVMEAASYFIVKDIPFEKWRHYALNFDVYTHFTSPIRRYPDVLVHRLLYKAILDEKQNDHIKLKEEQVALERLIETCNECKLNSRRASDGCDKIFLCIYLRERNIYTDAYVTFMSKAEFEIIIPEFNLERKIEYKSLKNLITYQIVTEDQINLKVQKQIKKYNDDKEAQQKKQQKEENDKVKKEQIVKDQEKDEKLQENEQQDSQTQVGPQQEQKPEIQQQDQKIEQVAENQDNEVNKETKRNKRRQNKTNKQQDDGEGKEIKEDKQEEQEIADKKTHNKDRKGKYNKKQQDDIPNKEQDNKEQKDKKQKDEEPQNWVAVLVYQDPDQQNQKRIFLIQQLQKLRIRLTATETFPIDFVVQIEIETQNKNKIML